MICFFKNPISLKTLPKIAQVTFNLSDGRWMNHVWQTFLLVFHQNHFILSLSLEIHPKYILCNNHILILHSLSAVGNPWMTWMRPRDPWHKFIEISAELPALFTPNRKERTREIPERDRIWKQEHVLPTQPPFYPVVVTLVGRWLRFV